MLINEEITEDSIMTGKPEFVFSK